MCEEKWIRWQLRKFTYFYVSNSLNCIPWYQLSLFIFNFLEQGNLKTVYVEIIHTSRAKIHSSSSTCLFLQEIIQDKNAATLKYTNVKEYKSHLQENFTVIVTIDFILNKPHVLLYISSLVSSQHPKLWIKISPHWRNILFCM